jgi:transcriptional antiterminator NusG
MVQYYAVHVLSGREQKSRDNLISRAVNQKMWGDTIMDILIPTEKVFTTKNGERKIVDKKVFPGYIFVKAHLDDHTQKLVQGTDGVSGFVRSGSKPVPMSEKEVENILKNIEEAKESAPKAQLKQKDTIRILAGPFADFNGIIESYDPVKGKIKAYINIFGRDTLTELNVDEVELQN